MTCGDTITLTVGRTQFDLTCQLKEDHLGGHRAPIEHEELNLILSWFPKKG